MVLTLQHGAYRGLPFLPYFDLLLGERSTIILALYLPIVTLCAALLYCYPYTNSLMSLNPTGTFSSRQEKLLTHLCVPTTWSMEQIYPANLLNQILLKV